MHPLLIKFTKNPQKKLSLHKNCKKSTNDVACLKEENEDDGGLSNALPLEVSSSKKKVSFTSVAQEVTKSYF